VIVGTSISRDSFVFSEPRVKVSANLTNVGSLAVELFDLANTIQLTLKMTCAQVVETSVTSSGSLQNRTTLTQTITLHELLILLRLDHLLDIKYITKLENYSM